MALNSINTNLAAMRAQSNIGIASNKASASIARLSSGNRITRAADDVAAMSAGTSLRTNVTTLKTALINTAQGSSLLQVADGALSQVVDILQRQKAIAVQAGAGSLTSAERSFLNQEFQNLAQEIDRLATQTNFNGVSLLDGALSERVSTTSNATAATSATASISLTTNIGAGDIFSLNGVAVTEGVDFTAGATITETLDNLVTALNSSSNVALSQATYERNGASLEITADNGGKQGEVYTINAGASTAISGAGTGVGVVNGATASQTNTVFTPATALAITDTTSSVTVAAAAATASSPFEAGETIDVDLGLGGGVVTAYTFVLGDSLEDIANGINANSAASGVTAKIIGSSGAYNIQLETTALSTANDYQAGSEVDITITGAAATVGQGYALEAAATTVDSGYVFSLGGGDDAGIGAGDVIGIGTVGDDIITNQNQQQSEVTISFAEIADADLLDATNFGNAGIVDFTIGNAAGTGLGTVTFAFSATGDGPTEAKVGATLEETLDNMVATINDFEGAGAEAYGANQYEAYRDGTDIKIRTKDVGGAADIAGNVITVADIDGDLPAGASISGGGTLNNGSSTGGVNTSGITNDDFIGVISGFSATFTGTTDTVDLSVEVGGITYAASAVNVNVTSDTVVRLASTGGGYFDVQLSGNKGEAVASQTDADRVADRLNGAFSSITFSQERAVTSFKGNAPITTNGVVTGSLIGTSVDIQLSDFSSVTVDKIRVNQPEGISENGTFEIELNGQTFRAEPDITAKLGANQTYRLTSTADAGAYIDFTTGDSAIEFDTLEKAQSFEQALREAFGVDSSSAAVSFQVGVTTTDSLEISINNITTREIYVGATLDVLTKDSAAVAADALDVAIDLVTAVRADVGALQSRFDFAAANVESSVTNQDAARGVLLDTDIASESTAFSQAQVQLQAGISVLAQANLLPQNLLKLIG